jgi:hypothetical protein
MSETQTFFETVDRMMGEALRPGVERFARGLSLPEGWVAGFYATVCSLNDRSATIIHFPLLTGPQ